MIQKIILLLSSVTLLACSSGEDKPSSDEIKSGISIRLPKYIQLENIEIEKQQNVGNEIEPEWGTRIKATVKTKYPLFSLDFLDKDRKVSFISLKTEKGTESDVYAKVYSRLFQGNWKHRVEIDGKPFNNLGKQRHQFFIDRYGEDQRVLVRGSEEESDYLSQFHEAHDFYYTALKTGITLSGEVKSTNKTWPITIKLHGFTNGKGDFDGEIEWDGYHTKKVSGNISYGTITINEGKRLKLTKKMELYGPIRCHANIPLIIENDKLKGTNTCTTIAGDKNYVIELSNNNYLKQSNKLVKQNIDLISGNWDGEYKCGQGATGLRLNISYKANEIQATFNFFPLRNNPNVPSGTFTMTGAIDGEGYIILNPVKWIKQPKGYTMVAMRGQINESGTALTGKIRKNNCAEFILHK